MSWLSLIKILPALLPLLTKLISLYKAHAPVDQMLAVVMEIVQLLVPSIPIIQLAGSTRDASGSADDQVSELVAVGCDEAQAREFVDAVTAA